MKWESTPKYTKPQKTFLISNFYKQIWEYLKSWSCFPKCWKKIN